MSYECSGDFFISKRKQELSMRHINVNYSIICICGENYDEFEHIFNCKYYEDIIQEFGSHTILQGKDHIRFLYDQNYINKSFSKNQIPKIDKLIKIFYHKMQKKRDEMFQEQDDVLKEANNFNHTYKNQEKGWKNRNLIKLEQEKEKEN